MKDSRLQVASPSIVMATYNGSQFLSEQLESLASQTELPTELIISDDCSTDATVEIAERFAKTSPFPVYIHRNATRKGYRDNFMDATAYATSDLVAFCDQDDVWHVDRIATVRRAFDDPAVLLVHHNATVVDRARRPVRILYSSNEFPLMSQPLTARPWTYPLGFTETFRKELLAFSHLRPGSQDPNKPDKPLAHDQWAYLLASSLGRTAFIERPLADYRQHGDNLFGADHSSSADRSAIEVFLQEKVNRYAKLADVARSRMILFGQIAAVPGHRAEIGENAATASARYRKLAEELKIRDWAYSSSWIFARAWFWIRLVVARGYNSSAWGTPPKLMLADLVFGVLFGRWRKVFVGSKRR